MDFYFGYFMFSKFDLDFAPITKALMIDAFDVSLNKQITASNYQLEKLQEFIIQTCKTLIKEPEYFLKENSNVSQD